MKGGSNYQSKKNQKKSIKIKIQNRIEEDENKKKKIKEKEKKHGNGSGACWLLFGILIFFLLPDLIDIYILYIFFCWSCTRTTLSVVRKRWLPLLRGRNCWLMFLGIFGSAAIIEIVPNGDSVSYWMSLNVIIITFLYLVRTVQHRSRER